MAYLIEGLYIALNSNGMCGRPSTSLPLREINRTNKLREFVNHLTDVCRSTAFDPDFKFVGSLILCNFPSDGVLVCA